MLAGQRRTSRACPRGSLTPGGTHACSIEPLQLPVQAAAQSGLQATGEHLPALDKQHAFPTHASIKDSTHYSLRPWRRSALLPGASQLGPARSSRAEARHAGAACRQPGRPGGAREPGVLQRLRGGRALRGVHGQKRLQERQRARVRLRHAPPQAGALGAQDLVAPLRPGLGSRVWPRAVQGGGCWRGRASAPCLQARASGRVWQRRALARAPAASACRTRTPGEAQTGERGRTACMQAQAVDAPGRRIASARQLQHARSSPPRARAQEPVRDGRPARGRAVRAERSKSAPARV